MNKRWIAAGVAGAIVLLFNQFAMAGAKPRIEVKAGHRGNVEKRGFGHVEPGTRFGKPWPPPRISCPPPMPPKPPIPLPRKGRPGCMAQVPKIDYFVDGNRCDCSFTDAPIIINMKNGRRLYQVRVHGHPAFLQEWSAHRREWVTIMAHPSIW